MVDPDGRLDEEIAIIRHSVVFRKSNVSSTYKQSVVGSRVFRANETVKLKSNRCSLIKGNEERINSKVADIRREEDGLGWRKVT